MDVDVVVAGLGPGGSAALARLGRKGINAVGIEGRGFEGERANLVLVRAGTRRSIRELERGRKSIWDWFLLPAAREIRDTERRLRAGAAASGVPAHYNTAIEGVERLDDGRTLVRMGSGDAYRARFLIDGSGGGDRVPGLDDIAPRLGKPIGRDFYTISMSRHRTRWPYRVRYVTDSQGGVHSVNVVRHRASGKFGTQVLTRSGPTRPTDPVALDNEMRKAMGVREPRTHGPVVVEVTPAIASAAWEGTILRTGDGVGRVHPKTGRGLNLAVRDGIDAADAVIAALRARNAAGVKRALAHYNTIVMERHQDALTASTRYIRAEATA